jgi:hypothetical protein
MCMRTKPMERRARTKAPPPWVIEEIERAEKERRRERERDEEGTPLRLPVPILDAPPHRPVPKEDAERGEPRVVVIDL